MMKALQVIDRPGWAIDRLAKPLGELNKDIDISYFSTSLHRYLDTGYSTLEGITEFDPEMARKYDIIHFHRLEATWPFIENISSEIRKILTIHTERLADWEDKRLLEFDDIVAPTKFAKEHFLKVFKNQKTLPRIHWIPHCIDLKKYYPDEDYLPQKKEIGYVGRIVPWKNWNYIQRAVYTAGYKLIGCGYIESASIYNEKRLIEQEDFSFSIFLPEPQMRNFYNRMNLLICGSEEHIEAGPLPILEAMACGIPVISTRVGWAIDHCEHLKDIYFIDHKLVRNVGEFSKVIKKVYNDTDLKQRLRQNALELIKGFGMDKYLEWNMAVYQSIN